MNRRGRPGHALGCHRGPASRRWQGVRPRVKGSLMSHLDCYRVMGLQPGATLSQVHRAYKRLAMRHHPDRTAGDPNSVRLFCQITDAYRVLRGVCRGRGSARPTGACPRCGRVSDLFRGMGGQTWCADCLLRGRRRFLPLGRFECVRCLGGFLLQVLALYCAVISATTGDWRFGAAGTALVLGAMAALGYSVWTADVIDRG